MLIISTRALRPGPGFVLDACVRIEGYVEMVAGFTERTTVRCLTEGDRTRHHVTRASPPSACTQPELVSTRRTQVHLDMIPDFRHGMQVTHKYSTIVLFRDTQYAWPSIPRAFPVQVRSKG